MLTFILVSTLVPTAAFAVGMQVDAPRFEVNADTITAIESPNAEVANGTPIEDWELPSTVNIMVNDGPTMAIRIVNVTWDATKLYDPNDGTTEVTYDATKKEEQKFAVFGDVELPSDVTNPNEIKARVDVTILAVNGEDPSSPKSGDEPNDEPNNDPNNVKDNSGSPKTGDNRNMVGLIILMIAAACGLGVVLVVNRKK